jgi:hypothetical protein
MIVGLCAAYSKNGKRKNTMPSETEAQHHFMEAVAHDPEFAKKVDVPQSVGEEFVEADKGKDALLGLHGGTGYGLASVTTVAPTNRNTNFRKEGLSGVNSITSSRGSK